MQLRNLKFWKQPEVEVAMSDSRGVQNEQNSNVIDMPLETPLDSPAGLTGVLPMSDSMYLNLKQKPIPRGPMAAKELTEFLFQKLYQLRSLCRSDAKDARSAGARTVRSDITIPERDRACN